MDGEKAVRRIYQQSAGEEGIFTGTGQRRAVYTAGAVQLRERKTICSQAAAGCCFRASGDGCGGLWALSGLQRIHTLGSKAAYSILYYIWRDGNGRETVGTVPGDICRKSRYTRCQGQSGNTVLSQYAGPDPLLWGCGQKGAVCPPGGSGAHDCAQALGEASWTKSAFPEGAESDPGGGAVPGGRRPEGALWGDPFLHRVSGAGQDGKNEDLSQSSVFPVQMSAGECDGRREAGKISLQGGQGEASAVL